MCRPTLPVTNITLFSSRVFYAAVPPRFPPVSLCGRPCDPKHRFVLARVPAWSRGQRCFAPDASTVSGLYLRTGRFTPHVDRARQGGPPRVYRTSPDFRLPRRCSRGRSECNDAPLLRCSDTSTTDTFRFRTVLNGGEEGGLARD